MILCDFVVKQLGMFIALQWLVGKEMVKSPNKIEFQNVSLAFEDRLVLDRVSFSVKPGEMKVILGGSGTGKSTLLKLAIGLIEPNEGKILIDGQDLSEKEESERNQIRKRMSMVFQSSALFNSLTVYENVAFRPREMGWDEEVVDREVQRVLDFVGLLESTEQLPDELSGGMKRRVAIARAIVDKPEIILYDEPTGGLDPPTSRLICEMSVKLRDIENVTSMFVTHKLDDIRFIASKYFNLEGDQGRLNDVGDRLCLTNTKFIMLHEGHIIFDGPGELLWDSCHPFIHKFLYGEAAA
jgi:phospholipid/cholesterol/gamma-HCH transport system ATP-binding protein